jgi:uncharacterized integral membrane protein
LLERSEACKIPANNRIRALSLLPAFQEIYSGCCTVAAHSCQSLRAFPRRRRGVLRPSELCPYGHGSSQATDAPEREGVPRRVPTDSATMVETRGERFRRKAHRTGLHLYAFLTVALLVCLVALAVANTDQVEFCWVVGSSTVSLVWIIIFSAILGWLLGIVTSVVFRWRTRARRYH